MIKLNSHGDHRLAMTLYVLASVDKNHRSNKDCDFFIKDKEIYIIEDIDCINTSFPNFFELMNKVRIEI